MEGIYKCTAENKANKTSSSGYLHVFGKKKKLPYSWSLLAGTKLNGICTVSKITSEEIQA